MSPFEPYLPEDFDEFWGEVVAEAADATTTNGLGSSSKGSRSRVSAIGG
jgi:cephalosporin-C deacetylase-like acetyl esterase